MFNYINPRNVKVDSKVFMVMRIHDDEYPIANSIDRNLACVL